MSSRRSSPARPPAIDPARPDYDARVPHDYRTATAASVTSETNAAIATADALVERAAASADQPSLTATLLPLELAGAAIGAGYGVGAFLGQVHTDPDVRDAGNQAEERINKWRIGVVFRDDVNRAVQAFAATPQAAALSGEDRRLLDHWLRDLRRAGHALDPAERQKLQTLRNRLVEIEGAFQRNINEYRDGIDVTREQLAGLPDSYVERLSSGDAPETYRVSLDYPELNPFLEQAADRGLRESLFLKHWNRAVDANRPLLTEALQLRQQIARLLGAATWAHYAMELMMAGSPDRVRAFYDQLLPPVAMATLEPNGARSGDDLVRGFLGRDASNEEFLRLRGMG